MATPIHYFSGIINESSNPPKFLPRNIPTASANGYSQGVATTTVRFLLDPSSQRLRGAGRAASITESQGPSNPCARREDGWAQFLGSEQWEQGYVDMSSNVTAGEVPPARFFFAQIAPDNHTECLNGLWGAVDATTTEVSAFEKAVALRLLQVPRSGTILTPSPTPSPNVDKIDINNTGNSTGGGISARVISIIAIAGVGALCISYFLFRCWLRRRRQRRDPEADDRQRFAAEFDQDFEGLAGANASTNTFAPSTSLSGQVVEHLVQDENHRLVMRAASLSSLPVYTIPAPPPPISTLPSHQQDSLSSSDSLREEARDEIPLAISPGGLSSTTAGGLPPAWRRGERRRERERRRQRGQEFPPSPTRTARSDAETLPEYMSMVSRPPSFVSRIGALG